MLFKFQSSYKQSIKGAPPARTKKKLKSNLSLGYMAGLKAAGNYQGSLNFMASKKKYTEKMGPLYQPTLRTVLERKLHQRPSMQGDFYGQQDLVTKNNFQYAKSTIDKRYMNVSASNINKMFRDRERDEQNWQRSVTVRSGLADLKKELGIDSKLYSKKCKTLPRILHDGRFQYKFKYWIRCKLPSTEKQQHHNIF